MNWLGQIRVIGAVMVLACSDGAWAAERGARVFDPGRVAEIRITVDPVDLWRLRNPEAAGEPEYVECVFEFDGVVVSNAAVRVKGNSSLLRARGGRYPFKIDFNREVRGQRFDGLKKLNLHTAPQYDPSRLAEFLSYGAFRELGIPSPRTGWADVWLNGEFLGLYTTVEQVDDDFLEDWFGHADGDLYKPELPGGTLEWRGTNILDYENLGHKLQEETDHGAFLNFVEVLNLGSDSELQRVLNIGSALRYLAGNMALGNDDGYTGAAHNYYLYESEPGRFSMLPWDMNLSQYAETNLYPGGGSVRWPGRPLTHHLLTNGVHRTAYHSMLHRFLTGPGSQEALFARIDEAEGVLTNRLDEEHLARLRDWIVRRLDGLLVNLAAVFTNTAHPRLVINEVMAANSAAYADDRGDFDDWIELHNPAAEAVDAGGMWLTDDLRRPRKWRIPGGQVIPAGEYLVIWADEDPGRLHANFKLAAAGEAVWLFDADARGNSPIDELRFTRLPRNVSFGRVPDGGPFEILLGPGSPGGANGAGDADGDGMPDAWEAAMEFDAGRADAGEDTDGDGAANGVEFRAGSDPREAGSFPGLKAERFGADELRVMWGTHVEGALLVEESAELENPVWNTVKVVQGTNAVVLPLQKRRGMGFYRVSGLHP